MPQKTPSFNTKPPKVKTFKQAQDASRYGHQWKKLRDSFIKHHPICDCSRVKVYHQQRIKTISVAQDKRQAVLVDHIQPISRGGANYDVENLQSLCYRCHSVKTKKWD